MKGINRVIGWYVGSGFGNFHRCPQGFAYWNVSRRCEPARKLLNCTPTTYNVGGNVPLEWLNIGHRRRSMLI